MAEGRHVFVVCQIVDELGVLLLKKEGVTSSHTTLIFKPFVAPVNNFIKWNSGSISYGKFGPLIV